MMGRIRSPKIYNRGKNTQKEQRKNKEFILFTRKVTSMSTRRSAILFLLPILFGMLILTSGCISEQPSPGAPLSPTENLTFYTEQLPPYNYQENGALKGFSVDLLEAITAKMGTKVAREEVHLVPWTEGYQTV